MGFQDRTATDYEYNEFAEVTKATQSALVQIDSMPPCDNYSASTGQCNRGESCTTQSHNYNPLTGACDACTWIHRHYNQQTGQCDLLESCRDGQHIEFSWDTESYQCTDCNERSGLFNASTGQCDTCNELHPDWNEVTGQCDFEYPLAYRCEHTNPYYNPASGQCDLCIPDSDHYDPDSGQCLNIEAVEFLVTEYERDKLGRITRKTESIRGESTEYVY